MAWLNEIKNPKTLQVITVKYTKKGVMLYTADYEVFLWGNSKAARDLTTAIEVWKENNNVGFEIFIVPDNKCKTGFNFELGNDVTYLEGENLWSLDPEEVEGTNMFLERARQLKNSSPQIPITTKQTKKAAKAIQDDPNSLHAQIAARIANNPPEPPKPTSNP
jgi:hypothetical protein